MLDRIQFGKLPTKNHTALRKADGGVYWEECITRDGFDSAYTIVYHEQRPHEAQPVELSHGWRIPTPGGPRSLLRRHFRSFDLPKNGGAPLNARTPLLANADVVVSVLRPTQEDPVYFNNGDADDLYFIFQGSGTLRTHLGDLRFAQDDYVYVPRGTIHRFIPDAGVEQYWLSLECLGGMGLLKQARNEVGQLRMDAPYGHRDFKRPDFKGPIDERLRELVVKQSGTFHGFSYKHSPLDIVGWDGAAYPWIFPILNFQPRVASVHLPPTIHGTFSARGALICSFVPRLVDFHPEAVPCPYPHSSVDVDEFLFYVRGNFTSRRGVGPGSISFHPAGIPHGPHPGAYEASIGSKETSELAVMLDCFLPLQPTAAALNIEDRSYHQSFVA